MTTRKTKFLSTRRTYDKTTGAEVLIPRIDTKVDLTPATRALTQEIIDTVVLNGTEPIQDNLDDAVEAVLNTPVEAPKSLQDEFLTSERPLTTGKGKPFQKGNKAARGRKPKLAMLGVDLNHIDVHDKRLKSAMRRAEYYLKRRSRELCVMFGSVSAGVNGILSSAALQLAFAKYNAQLATEAAGKNTKRYLELMNFSIKFQNSARTNELAAYELCAKESNSLKGARDKLPSWLRESSIEAPEFAGAVSTEPESVPQSNT